MCPAHALQKTGGARQAPHARPRVPGRPLRGCGQRGCREQRRLGRQHCRSAQPGAGGFGVVV
eukprot:410482-Alexandrium_andersonii.AAC.1